MSDSVRKVHLVGAALAAVAAGLLLFGSWSTAWWRGDDGAFSFSAGVRFIELCTESECNDSPLASVGGDGWMRIGLGVFTAGMVGAALLLAAAVRALVRPGARSAFPGAAALACVAAVILGIAFLVLAPDEVTSLDLGLAVIAYFAGAAIGAGSAGGLLLRP